MTRPSCLVMGSSPADRHPSALANHMSTANILTAGSPQSIAYRPDIDGLRGFGALLVLWFHFCETWKKSPYKGADLTNSTFFAVSGFVITLSVLRAMEKNPDSPLRVINLKNTARFAVVFFCRRLQRLVITQLFVTTITAAVFCTIHTPGPLLLSFITTSRFSIIGASNLYFAYRKGETFYVDTDENELNLSHNPLMHTWYLGVEEQAYLLYPWVFALAHLYSERHHFAPYAVFGIFFIASFFASYMIDDQQQMRLGFFLLQYRGWEILIGVITCHLLVYSKWSPSPIKVNNTTLRDPDNKVEMDNLLKLPPQRKEDAPIATKHSLFLNFRLLWIQIASVSLVSCSSWLFFYPEHSLLATSMALSGTVLFFVSGHGYDWSRVYSQSTISEINFLQEIPLLNYCYGLSWSAFVGRISYAMYLWHFPVAVISADYKTEIQYWIGISDAVSFALQFTIVFFLSLVTHYFVENPFRWWKPNVWYHPTLWVLFLMGITEIWLVDVHRRVQHRTFEYVVNPTKVGGVSAIFDFSALIATITLCFVLIITWNSLFSNQKESKGRLPMGSAFFVVLCLVITCLSSVMSGSYETHETKHEKIIISDFTPSSRSTFWNWRDGTHSFASFGCGCQTDPTNPRPPLDASNEEEFPMCFDIGHWKNESHLAFNDRGPEFNDCFYHSFGMNNDASQIWDECLVAGRPTSSKKRRSTAFVFGNSASVMFRVAVANAIGGEFNILGYASAMFGVQGKRMNDIKYLLLLTIEDDIIDPGLSRINFNAMDAKKAMSVKDISAKKLQSITAGLTYVERIGKLLDEHLKEGDLIFFPFELPSFDNESTSQLFIKSFSQLGQIAKSRGATLVLSFGSYAPSHKNGKVNEDTFKYFKRRKDREKIYKNLLATHEAIVNWSGFGNQFCGERKCTQDISGTSEPALLKNNNGVIDYWHPSSQGEAFLAPYLCSFLKDHSLIDKMEPDKHIIEIRFDKEHIDMNELRDISDQYHVFVIQLPSHLRKSALLSVETIYEPLSHRNIIHHISLFKCNHFPEQSPGVGKSFRYEGFGIPGVCEDHIISQGAESPQIVFPEADGVQYGLLLDVEFVLAQIHFKFPVDEAFIMGDTEEDTRAKKNEMSKLQGMESVTDSSGLRLRLISDDEARLLNFQLRYVSLTLISPLNGNMLRIPPGNPSHKVTSVCPRECFADSLDRIGETEVSIVAVANHAHLSATAVYGQIFNLKKKTMDFAAVDTNWTERLGKGEMMTILEKPIPITSDTFISVTCDYNTSDRTTETFLGTSVQDEMCQLLLFINPPLPELSICWHVDGRVVGLAANECIARCGQRPSLKFNIPQGTSNWLSNTGSFEEQDELSKHWPHPPVCEF